MSKHKSISSLLLSTFIWVVGTASTFAQSPLPIGIKAPPLEGKNQHGDKVSLVELNKKGPVVVMFYRGQWCPHCNRQISNVQDSLTFILERGASVIVVTPEQGEAVDKTIAKTNAIFSIVSDQNHKIMDDWNVSFKLKRKLRCAYRLVGIRIKKAGGSNDNYLPVPATYIISPDGTIYGSHFNEKYADRMPVSDIISTLKRMQRK